MDTIKELWEKLLGAMSTYLKLYIGLTILAMPVTMIWELCYCRSLQGLYLVFISTFVALPLFSICNLVGNMPKKGDRRSLLEVTFAPFIGLPCFVFINISVFIQRL